MQLGSTMGLVVNWLKENTAKVMTKLESKITNLNRCKLRLKIIWLKFYLNY
jgi:hypothetical protein